jgi:hypothetical protein
MALVHYGQSEGDVPILVKNQRACQKGCTFCFCKQLQAFAD